MRRTPYDLGLDRWTLAEARRDGFDPTADIVRSALGVPESTGLSPAEYEVEVARALELVQQDERFVGARDGAAGRTRRRRFAESPAVSLPPSRRTRTASSADMGVRQLIAEVHALDNFSALFGERRGTGSARQPAVSGPVRASVRGPGLELGFDDVREQLSELEDGVLALLYGESSRPFRRGQAPPQSIMCAKLCLASVSGLDAQRLFGRAPERYRLAIDRWALGQLIAAERPAAFRRAGDRSKRRPRSRPAGGLSCQAWTN